MQTAHFHETRLAGETAVHTIELRDADHVLVAYTELDTLEPCETQRGSLLMYSTSLLAHDSGGGLPLSDEYPPDAQDCG